MIVNLKLKPATDVRDFITDARTRRLGMLYFQLTGDCDMVARMITEHTDGEWLKTMIMKGKIYQCDERIICEQS